MADYGFDSTGFTPKRLADIRSEITTNIEAIVDEEGNTPFTNVSDDAILSQLVGIFSEQLATCWGSAYDAFIQFNPLYNTGAGQSATVQLNGITRFVGSKAKVNVSITGTAGVTVPAGSLIANYTGDIVFAIDDPILIGANGTGTGTASNQVKGSVNISNNTLVFIKSPMVGWSTVTNTGLVANGTDEETDEALRVRQQRSTEATSYRQVDSIYSAVSALEGVTYCRVYVNASTSTDAKGIPAKEVAVLAIGGNDDEIAKALFLRFPLCIQGYGTTTVNMRDTQGVLYPIKFSRPTQVPVHIRISISVTGYDFPVDYEQKIKDAIVNYADYNRNKNSGFQVGENVYVSKLYTPINTVSGLIINSVEVSADGQIWSSVDLDIDWDELATFDQSNITVTLV